MNLEQRRISPRMGLPKIVTVPKGDAPYQRGYHNQQSGLLPPSKTTVEETQAAPDSVVQEGGELAGIDPVGLCPRVAQLGGSRIESKEGARGQGDSGAHGSLWISLLRLRIKRCSRRADRGRGEDGDRTANLSHGWRRGTAYQRGEADA